MRKTARSAGFLYESLLRRRAPRVLSSGSGRECDETIGRFCFRFGDGDDPESPPHPEHPHVGEARRLAIAAYRRWLSAEPASGEAAGAVIRYLVEEGHAEQAVSIARTHAWAAARSAESYLLLGLALHHAGRFPAAEVVFDTALAGLPPGRQEALRSVEPLLDPGERRRYRRLPPVERRSYDERFWAFSDPSLLVPGHERRSAHLARHAWATILERAPAAAGRLSWGWDQEEILVRYGRPVSRERESRPAWQIHRDLSMIESFDPRAVSFVPGALLTRGLPPTPPPGDRGSLERDSARSAYTPVLHPRTRSLAVQATRLPIPGQTGGAVLRLDAALMPDTTEPAVAVAPRALLAVLDTFGVELARRTVQPTLRPDSVWVLTAEVPLPAGAFVYRLEAVDDSTGLAGLARYRVDIEPGGPLRLSDPLIAALPAGAMPVARGELVASPTGVVPPEPFLLWAEVSGLVRSGGEGRYEVEWWVESAERPGAVAAATRWLGRQLGLGGSGEPVRVRWEGSSEADPAPIGFAVDPSDLEAGLYRLNLGIRDLVSGREAVVERLFRVDPAAPGPRGRAAPR